jgi:hypothetical protein
LESIDNQLFIHHIKIVKVVTVSIPHSLVIPKESFVPRFVIPKESFVPTEWQSEGWIYKILGFILTMSPINPSSNERI